MRIINLTNAEKSEIKYKISTFPDGQQNIKIDVHEAHDQTWIGNSLSYFRTGEIKIVSHLNNWLDLELIVCTVACLRELDIKEIHLVTPYFVGARSDRKFESGGNWYLKQVICPIINNLNLASVLVLDPHSWVLGNLLNNFKYVDNLNLVKWALKSYQYDNKKILGNMNDGFILISPDAGASHKIQKIAEAIGYNGEIITCTKERDTDGKLTKTVVPLSNVDHYEKDYIIIDDICDGGRTFINIAKKIKESLLPTSKSKIYLIVTHGIFSAGFEELAKYFDNIYCTNSYKTYSNGVVNENSMVKQLNVY